LKYNCPHCLEDREHPLFCLGCAEPYAPRAMIAALVAVNLLIFAVALNYWRF